MKNIFKAVVINEILAVVTAAVMSVVLALIYNTFDQAWYFFLFWLVILQLFVLANVVRTVKRKI
jgi:hypothetical protein